MRYHKWRRALLMLLPTALFAYPLYYLFETSLRKQGFGNYVYVLTKIRIEQNVINSLTVAIATVALVLLLSLPAAFGFSKLRMRGKGPLFTLILVALMIPGIGIAVPMVRIIRGMGLVNNALSLVLCYSALNAPFALMLARGYMDDLSGEMMDAALIDGCTTFRALIHVFVPLSAPVIAIMSVFTFLNSWNEYLYATLFMKKEYLQMASTIPNKFQVAMYTNVPALFAGLVIVQLPVLILYLRFQGVFREGMTAGAVKG